MTTFGTLLPKPVDKSLIYLTEEDWKFLQKNQLVSSYQEELKKQILNIVKSVPPEIVKPKHLKRVFEQVNSYYYFQCSAKNLPSEEVKQ